MTADTANTLTPATVLKNGYTALEEKAHALSHGIALALAVVGIFFLVNAARAASEPAAITAVLIYGLSMVAVFGASTLYHGAYKSRFQRFFKLLDHSAIFTKIAGTYTPFALLVLPTETGIPILVAVWSLAAIGIVFKTWGYALSGGDKKAPKSFAVLSLMIYLGMGWSGVYLIGDLADLLPGNGVWWLIAGGLAYTVGAGVYAMKKVKFSHFVWHLFVVAGSACHFVTVYFFVV